MWSEIEEQVIAGERPKIPAFCPPQLSDIISKCWNGDASQRPDATAAIVLLNTAIKFGERMDRDFGQKSREAMKERRERLEKEKEEQRKREEEAEMQQEIARAKVFISSE